MRRLLLVLTMVILLPLRAVAGDAMMLAMAGGTSHGGAAAMAPDCPMLLGAAALDGHEAVDGAPSPSEASCESCTLCLPLLQPSDAVAGRSADLAGAPDGRADTFLSALPARSFRPPRL